MRMTVAVACLLKQTVCRLRFPVKANFASASAWGK
jgi:hypothetical protein